jgi:hypothetical protein
MDEALSVNFQIDRRLHQAPVWWSPPSPLTSPALIPTIAATQAELKLIVFM